MEYLGSKEVIHGDLFLKNVLIDSNGVAKVTDFGLAHQFGFNGKRYLRAHGVSQSLDQIKSYLSLKFCRAHFHSLNFSRLRFGVRQGNFRQPSTSGLLGFCYGKCFLSVRRLIAGGARWS